MNQRISIENSNIYFYNSKNIWNFQFFFGRFERKIQFYIKNKMFTNIFLNIELLLKKEKLKILLLFYLKLCIFCTELNNEDV